MRVQLYASLAGLAAASAAAAWPNGPLVTSGRWIVDASGNNVTFAGVNWPGAADVMIPEGLQYQSIATIVSSIRSLGMNAVRLTYATEMVDQIFSNNMTDVPISRALTDALGTTNGTAVLARILANNPSFTASTTRLQVFDAVAAELARHNMYVHLDNHISKGTWCCSLTDGNGWWGDTYFSVSNWTRGLSYMASHGRATWPNMLSMSLRNEPRSPDDNATLAAAAYNWGDWYAHVRLGAAAIHAAHPGALIFLSGMSYDTTLTPVVQGTALSYPNGTSYRYSAADFPGFADKLVLELHNYATSTTSCAGLRASLYSAGFQTLNASDPTTVNVFPMLMTEFGFDVKSAWQSTYATCLAEYLPEMRVGWMQWVLAGSYYVREGTQDSDETWGLLDHEWKAWRNGEYVNGTLVGMVNATVGTSG